MKMREILFRGKRVDNCGWVEGFYLYTDENTHPVIIDMKCCSHIIIPETVGQYTGLTDRNGKKIFDGDIVIFNRERNLPNTDKSPEVIIYHQWDCAFQRYPYGRCITKGGAGKLIQPDMMSECEIIGNIHDNPELLKGE